MRTLQRNRIGRRKAFTLVEMLIVGALIALFAAMAIFGVQQQFRSNQRKAVIGEARQLASALDFAYNDLGFFPKIAYLQDSMATLRVESQRQYGNPNTVFARFSAYNIPTVRQSIDTQWRGPYFAASQSRSRVAQGRGGSRYMQLGVGANEPGWPWAVDTWNNPYMFYSMNLDPDTSSLYFTTARADDPNVPNADPGATGNFINAVVSYGPNQIPGGGELYIPTGARDDKTIAPGATHSLRLYTGDPNNESVPLTLLTGLDLVGSDGAQRANAWGVNFMSAAGFPINVGSTVLALDDDGNNAVGISDIGSDDVVFTF